MMTKDGHNKIVIFMTTGASDLVLQGGLCRHKVEWMISLNSRLRKIDQTNKYIVMITNEGSIKIVNIMIPGAGFICYGMAILVI